MIARRIFWFRLILVVLRRAARADAIGQLRLLREAAWEKLRKA
jgi:hypothetical protein